MAMKKTGLRELRTACGLQLRELAARLCVPATLVSKWERGLEPPSSELRAALAHELGVPVDAVERKIYEYTRAATPGEGYTTSRAGDGEIVERRREVPEGARRIADLFCGAGGLSFGFEQAGTFVTTCGLDLLPDRIESFVANHPHATGVAGDIRQFSARRLGELAGPLDVIVGGPPCQGFSSIRPFRNLLEDDPRNSLVEHYVLMISRLKPTWFVFENVVGILTTDAGQKLEAVVKGLESAGYRVDWRVLNAALFGIPQFRERVVIVGNRLGIEFKWPTPTHRAEYKSMAGSRREVVRIEPLFAAKLPPAVSLMEAIGELPEVESGAEKTRYTKLPSTPYQTLMREGANELTLHRATNHSPKMLEIIRHAGANINALPPGMVTSGFSSCYSRLAPDKPSTTVTVNFVHPASNRCIHPYQNRALTPREGARLQSFPDRFVFKGTSAQVVKQIGNAVPPLLGTAIATAILASERAAGLPVAQVPGKAAAR